MPALLNEDGSPLDPFTTPKENFGLPLEQNPPWYSETMPARPNGPVWSDPMESRQPTLAPSWSKLAGASFRQENEILNAARLLGADRDFGAVDPQHNPWDTIAGTEMQEHWEHFTSSRNQRETDYIKSRIKQELDDRRTRDAAGFGAAFLTDAAASILSPTTLIPGGAIYKGYRAGSAALKSAASVAALATAGVAAQELALRQMQFTRTWTESMMNVAGGTVLGGLLGGGVSHFSSAALRRASRQIDAHLAEIAAEKAARDLEPNTVMTRDQLASAPQAAGAAPARVVADNLVEGAYGLERAFSWQGPMTRVLANEIRAARDVMTRLAEIPLRLRQNREGIATGPAGGSVESRIKVDGDVAMYRASESLHKAFAEYRYGNADAKFAKAKAAFADVLKPEQGRLGWREFKSEVTKALRSQTEKGIEHPIPAVKAAAESFRKDIFEPFKKEAQKLGLFPEDAEFSFNYVMRRYDVNAILNDYERFKQILVDHLKGGQARARAELAAVEREIAAARGEGDMSGEVDALRQQFEAERARIMEARSAQDNVKASQAEDAAYLDELTRAKADTTEGKAALDAERLDVETRMADEKAAGKKSEPGEDGGDPVFASRMADEQMVRDLLEKGRTYKLSDNDIVGQFMAFEPYADLLPPGSRFGAWASLAPVPGEPGKALATFRFDGGEIAIIADADNWIGARAMYLPDDDIIIPFSVLGLDDAGHEVASGIYHELAHAAWSRFGPVERARLAVHAESLGVMQMIYRDLLRITGDPSWHKADPTWTTEKLYRESIYGSKDYDAVREDLLAQESVAFMQELHYAGHFTDEQVAPVLDMLMNMRGGDVRGKPGGGGPMFAAGATQDALPPVPVRSVDELGFGPLKDVRAEYDALIAQYRDLRASLPPELRNNAYKHQWYSENMREWARSEWASPEEKAWGPLLDRHGPTIDAVRQAERELNRLGKELDKAGLAESLTKLAQEPRPADPSMMVYHGTEAEFRKFSGETAREKADTTRKFDTDVIFVTPNKAFADGYGRPVPLELKSGFYFDLENQHDLARLAPFINSQPNAAKFWDRVEKGGQTWGMLENKETFAELKRLGYDGVMMSEQYHTATNVRLARTIAVFTEGKVVHRGSSDVMFAAGAPEPPRTIRAFHGTNSRFDTFDTSKTNEAGFHFGTEPQANARRESHGADGWFSRWRNIPVEIDATKILDLKGDPGWFGGTALARQLHKDGFMPEEVVAQVRKLEAKDLNGANKLIRDWIKDQGYDLVRYPNRVEGGGDYSYMALGTGNVRNADTGKVMFAAGAPEGEPPRVELDPATWRPPYGARDDELAKLDALAKEMDPSGIIDRITAWAMTAHIGGNFGEFRRLATERAPKTPEEVQTLAAMDHARERMLAYAEQVNPEHKIQDFTARWTGIKSNADLKEGDVFTEPSFMSTTKGFVPNFQSIDPMTANAYALIRVSHWSGIDIEASPFIKEVSLNKGEQEVILPPGQSFRVTKVERNSAGFPQIWVEEIAPAARAQPEPAPLQLDPAVISAVEGMAARLGIQMPDLKGLDLDAMMQAVAKSISDMTGMGKATGNTADLKALHAKADELRFIADASDQELGSIAADTISTITGSPAARGVNPYAAELLQGRSGPLKARTLKIPDEKIVDFLDDDIERIALQYVRAMAPDVALAREFGDINLTEDLKRIQDEANNMAAANPERAAEIITQANKAQQDIQAVAARLRGTLNIANDPTSFGPRAAQVVKQGNVLRLMGAVVAASISDVPKLLFVHGFRQNADLFSTLVTHLDGLKMAKAEAKELSAGLEFVLSRSGQLWDAFEDMAGHTMPERALRVATNKFGRLTLMDQWNATWKQLSGIMTMNRVLRHSVDLMNGRLNAKDLGKLAASGIDEAIAERIAAQYQQHGTVYGRLFLANANEWDDPLARQALAAAVRREADITITTPGQERPIWTSKTYGSVVGQFRTFQLVSIQRTLIAGLQEMDAAKVTAIAGMIALGMLSEQLKMIIHGKENKPGKPKDLGDWMYVGLANSGVLGWLTDADQMAHKVSRGNVSLGKFAFGKDEPISRFASQNAVGALLGPTYGAGSDIIQTLGAASAGQLRESDVHAMRRLLPYQNLFYISRALREFEEGMIDAMGVPRTQRRN